MAFATDTTDFPRVDLKPEALVSLPVGVASPLWGFYAGAALSGVAYWWMTQWTRPMNLEALFGTTVAPALQVAAVAPTPTEVVQKVEAAVETLTAELPNLPDAPIGGEAGPISAVTAVEAVTEAVIAPVVKTVEATEKVVEEAAAAAPLPPKETTAPSGVAPPKAAATPASEPRSVTPKAKPAAEQPRST